MSYRGIVLGSSGFLGSRLVKTYSDHLVAGPRFKAHTAADLAELEANLENFLDKVPADTIVNCIGLRQGTDVQLTLANQDIPRVVVNLARKRSLRVIHIGSAAELVSAREGADPKIARSILRYSESKKAGTRESLRYEKAAVARIHNLHGLPHQSSSSLHSLCRAITPTSVLQEPQKSPLIDVTRDYIHWQVALAELRSILDANAIGIIDVRSGISVSLRTVIEHLPIKLRSELLPRLVPAEILTDVPTIDGSATPVEFMEMKASELADEVLRCAETRPLNSPHEGSA